MRHWIEISQQLGFFLLGIAQMALFNMTIATNVFGDAGQRDRGGQILVGQPGQQARHQIAILFDQCALGLSFFCMTERIKEAAAQEAEFRQQRENPANPAAKLTLDLMAVCIL